MYFYRTSKSHGSTHTYCTVFYRLIFHNTLLWDGIVIDMMQIYHPTTLVCRSFPYHIQVVKYLRNIDYFCSKLSEQAPLKQFREVVH